MPCGLGAPAAVRLVVVLAASPSGARVCGSATRGQACLRLGPGSAPTVRCPTRPWSSLGSAGRTSSSPRPSTVGAALVSYSATTPRTGRKGCLARCLTVHASARWCGATPIARFRPLTGAIAPRVSGAVRRRRSTRGSAAVVVGAPRAVATACSAPSAPTRGAGHRARARARCPRETCSCSSTPCWPGISRTAIIGATRTLVPTTHRRTASRVRRGRTSARGITCTTR